MQRRMPLFAAALCISLAAGAAVVGAGTGATAAPAAGHYTGTLADGATWIADTPAK